MEALRGAAALRGLLQGGIGGALTAIADPEIQNALADYDWDDFMHGDLPPPFDFLNGTPGLDGLLTQPVTQKRKGTPAASFWGSAPYFGLKVPFEGAETGQGYSFSMSVMQRIYDKNPSPIALWNPWYHGQAGGARGTPDLLNNLGVKGPRPLEWNFHEVYGFFNQSPIGVGLLGPVGGDTRKSYGFVWETPVYRSMVSAPDAMAQAANFDLTSVRSVTRNGVTFLAKAAPVGVLLPYVPVPWSWAQVDAVNWLKQKAGVQVRDNGREDGWLGAESGGKTIIPPRGPILTLPGEPLPHPPGPGTKEKKVRVGPALLQVAQKAFHAITEYQDAVDALFDAIPKSKRCKTKSLVGKSWCVFIHLDDVDIGDAIVNLLWNQFEDEVIGKELFGRNANAAAARGDPYSFRTLNSMNGFGGLEELGELYGEFSQEYVNPVKDDLKKFLTDKYGI
ncbi:hypothetical protein [Rhizobium leguminosarum]